MTRASTSPEFSESPEIVLIFQGRSGSTEKVLKFYKTVRNFPPFLSFLSQVEQEIRIFENFRISSYRSTEKVLNFSVKEVLKKY